MTSLRQHGLPLLFALSAALAQSASLISADALRAGVAPYLLEPLPKIETLVGVSMRPAMPMLVVASFGDDAALAGTDRGFAVGRALNELSFGAHPDLDVENPTYYAFDTSDHGVTVGFKRDSRANAYRVARRESAQWCVYGTVEADRPARIDVAVDRCKPSNDAQRKRFEVGSSGDWPATLAAICRFIIDSVGVRNPQASAAPCARAKSLRAPSILAYGRYAASGMTLEELEAVVAEDPSFVPAVVDLIHRLPYDGDWRAFVDRRKRLVAGAGGTPAVILTALSRHLATYGWKIDRDIYEPMYAFVRAHPQLRAGWLTLATRLAEGSTHDHRPAGAPVHSYHPNASTHSAALTLSMAYFANWPDSYRARWQAGYALMRYAWTLRGSSTWEHIPALGRTALNPLMRMAEPMIAAALEAQPYATPLWENYIEIQVHIDGDWRGAFDTAIARLPQARAIYETAMRFSQRHWGGSAADIERIESQARKHNPKAEWVDTLRSRHLWKDPSDPATTTRGA